MSNLVVRKIEVKYGFDGNFTELLKRQRTYTWLLKKTKFFVAVENVVFLFFQFSTFPTWICFCMFGFDCWSCFNVKYLEAQNGFPTQSYRFIIVPFGIASRREKARYRERQFDWHVCGMMESLELINRCKTIFYSQLYIMFRYCRLMGLHDMFLSPNLNIFDRCYSNRIRIFDETQITLKINGEQHLQRIQMPQQRFAPLTRWILWKCGKRKEISSQYRNWCMFTVIGSNFSNRWMHSLLNLAKFKTKTKWIQPLKCYKLAWHGRVKHSCEPSNLALLERNIAHSNFIVHWHIPVNQEDTRNWKQIRFSIPFKKKTHPKHADTDSFRIYIPNMSRNWMEFELQWVKFKFSIEIILIWV